MEILPVIKLVKQEQTFEEKEEDTTTEDKTEDEEQNEEQTTLPEFKEKEKISEQDIFEDKTKPVAIKTEKPKKPKRQITEAQREHLRKGREKALAIRRAKAEEKKEIKDLTEKKKKKDIQKLRDEVDDKPAPAPAPISKAELPTGMKSLDPEFIRKLQLEAIEGYEKVRQERKAKKKVEQNKSFRDNSTMNTINNALNPPQAVKYGQANFFSHLF